MDITTLTSLINTFRAETKQDSITPDSLGLLLQRIVNVLGQASETSAVQQITQWKNTISSIGAVLTSLALASDDRNNIDPKLFLMILRRQYLFSLLSWI